MNWRQIEALVAAGMEIGSHSVTHTPPALLGPRELLREMVESKRVLEDRLGVQIRSASSPTGFPNPRLALAAREAGYHALCYGRIALWAGPEESFEIPRLPVKCGTTISVFSRMVVGDPTLIAPMRRRQLVRDALKRSLGVNAYRTLRRGVLGLFGASR
jgi:peptidoglycan/xylan/chitin deacetylase (PgdA/CDA1 family)